MRLAVIGAGGFVGQHIARLSQDYGVSALLLNDLTDFDAPEGSRKLIGSFSEPNIASELCDADALIVLASILGGAAEQNYPLARQINVDATLSLFEQVRDKNPTCRVVFASSIAVLGDLAGPVTDTTEARPTMVYGAQKLMMETVLSQFTRRGWLDGVSLRLSGVMARDGADAALKTAFMSRLFWCVARGEDITLPVSPTATTWLTSVSVAAQNFLLGATLPDMGDRRALTLPAQYVTFADLVSAVKAAHPKSQSVVTFDPDPDLDQLFGRFPPLSTPTADALGFVRDDTLQALVANSMT